MKIRKALAADVQALATIEQSQPFAAGWGEAGFSGELQVQAATIWCAGQNGQIQGFLALRASSGESEILNVAVDPSCVRQGIGFALLMHALTDLQHQAVTHVSLEAAQDNQAASRLYAKAGFRISGRRKNFYGLGKDALIWEKNL